MAPLPNTRHERFCQEIIKGQNATDAYCAAGYKAEGGAARANASRLLTDANVQARIAELNAGAAEKAEISKARFTKDLLRLAEKSEAMEGPAAMSAARQCYMDAAKLNGMIVERKEMGPAGIFEELERMNADELRDFIHRETEAAGLRDQDLSEDFGARPPRGELN
jgi:hypothetical protein